MHLTKWQCRFFGHKYGSDGFCTHNCGWSRPVYGQKKKAAGIE